MIKTRFAPSPTGLLHLGNIRTALFNYLLALGLKNQNEEAEFILRIEDTDTQRSQEKFINQIKKDLNWLKIKIDDKQTVRQSQRTEIYQRYFNLLINQNKIYPCFCTQQRLEELKVKQNKQKKPPSYDRKCTNLSEEEIKKKISQGKKPAYRFKLSQKEIFLYDLRHGKKQDLSNYGDFVIRKPNGSFVFLLTNLIDDIEQKITHSIRGEDHLSNSVLQTAICEALELKAPIYLHLSLIVNSEGKPLSKRDGVFSLQDLKEKSYHPLAIINYLSRLGNSLNNNQVLSLEQLAHYFKIERLAKSLAKSASQFDITQLNYWQKRVISSLSIDDLMDWLDIKDDMVAKNKKDKQTNILKVIQDNLLFKDDYLQLNKIFNDDSNLNYLNKKNLKNSENQKFIEVIENIPNHFLEIIKFAITHEWNYQKLLNELKEKTNLRSKELFMPLRVIISAQFQGPKIADIYKHIDSTLMLNRVEYCLKFKQK